MTDVRLHADAAELGLARIFEARSAAVQQAPLRAAHKFQLAKHASGRRNARRLFWRNEVILDQHAVPVVMRRVHREAPRRLEHRQLSRCKKLKRPFTDGWARVPSPAPPKVRLYLDRRHRESVLPVFPAPFPAAVDCLDLRAG